MFPICLLPSLAWQIVLAVCRQRPIMRATQLLFSHTHASFLWPAARSTRCSRGL